MSPAGLLLVTASGRSRANTLKDSGVFGSDGFFSGSSASSLGLCEREFVRCLSASSRRTTGERVFQGCSRICERRRGSFKSSWTLRRLRSRREAWLLGGNIIIYTNNNKIFCQQFTRPMDTHDTSHHITSTCASSSFAPEPSLRPRGPTFRSGRWSTTRVRSPYRSCRPHCGRRSCGPPPTRVPHMVIG